jgi:CxxC motif-containing protein (DUF1111 family)
VPALGAVAGIYSDLLLHDMGNELADPAAANQLGPSGQIVSVTAYYGGSQDVLVAVAPEAQRQWRTPPLWGAAKSAPYLHDGRAATLDDAILSHAGEAVSARNSYAALKSEKRNLVVAFVQSVGVPRSAD